MKIEINTHSKNIIRWGKLHPEAVVLSGDLGSSCEIKEFGQVFPERYFSMGIAEQNMVSWAAGLCREGLRPYLHTFGVFLYRRVLDQVEMSVAYPNLPVTFVGFLPGIMTPGGVSHQATNDVAVLRNVPNMTIFDMGDATEIESVLDLAYGVNGPVFIRMLRKEVPRLFPADQPMEFNRARVLSQGGDVALFSSGICTEEAMRATAVLKKKGLSIQHLHISTLKPFSDPQVAEAIAKARYGCIAIENHVTIGGLGSAVADTIAEGGLGKRLIKIGLRDTYCHGASKMYLLKKYGLDAMTLIAAAEELTGQQFGVDESQLEEIRFEDYSAV
ncbi:MAG: transketolase [Peptococcaceae bacterium]|jgi:transketolase|nr:transketolase [Peptococcaceae bacterium]